jgi:hypothetical protein
VPLRRQAAFPSSAAPPPADDLAISSGVPTREQAGRRGNVLAHAGRFVFLGCDCKGFVAHRHCKYRDCLAALLRRRLVKPAAV